MTRRPAAREIDIRRAIRAARAEGWGAVAVATDGTVWVCSEVAPIERPAANENTKPGSVWDAA